ADFGTKIIMTRQHFVDKICGMAAETHERISNGKEKLELKYKSSIDYKHCSESEIKQSFIDALEKTISVDLRRGSTHKGPHRDEILFYINENEVKTYSSQGQQRTALLSLKISELKYMDNETGEMPILLLDDVFSELDTERQKYLVDFIKNIQTIITCTDVEYLEKLKLEGSKVYEVVEGMVIKAV
ncbi:MAG TPA: DNA replication and repair protein RecF, partial [Patescibacteria group bacterium]|nr:DNA replication and repair protein RecF [Patescibacteria group bacterium]